MINADTHTNRQTDAKNVKQSWDPPAECEVRGWLVKIGNFGAYWVLA